MSYIYCITNNINGKQYVGKTDGSIEQRFKQHIKDKNRKEFEIRPLYRAFNKYGSENFSVEQLEECFVEESSDREIYWINKLDTYHNGYNATLGGDGKVLYNYKELADKYLELQSLMKTAKYFNCDTGTVRRACLSQNISCSVGVYQNKVNGTKVYMVDKETDLVLKEFDSAAMAARELTGKRDGNTHILEVCKGKRKTAYGYKWQSSIIGNAASS